MLSRLGFGLLLLIAGLGCGLIIATSPDVAAAAIVLELPGALVWLFDPTPRRAVGRTVVLFQAAASVRPIAALWYRCDGLRQCVAMATETRTLLIVLLASATGLLLTLALPMLVKVIEDAHASVRLTHLREARQRLTDEWEL